MSTKSEPAERPKKKKKKKQSGGAGIPPLLLWLGIGGGSLVVVIVLVVVIIVAAPWNSIGADKKPAPNNNPEPQQVGKLGGNVVKEPKSLLGNARRRADEVARDNEMRNIALFFQQYCLVNRNPGTRTLDSFLDFFKRDSNAIYNAVKEEKAYTVNVKARDGSEDILAYETDPYSDGTYYCIRANSQLEYVSEQKLKAGLGQ
jgi:hypothetical protein